MIPEEANVAEFADLIGKTLIDVSILRNDNDDHEIVFTSIDGDKFKLYHCQDCCETVDIEDISGDVTDLIGNPILVAAEVSQEDPNASESGTWTFYKLATIKGWVDIRWYGSSNGYYSESVYFTKL